MQQRGNPQIMGFENCTSLLEIKGTFIMKRENGILHNETFILSSLAIVPPVTDGLHRLFAVICADRFTSRGIGVEPSAIIQKITS